MSTTHSSFHQYCISHKTISHRAAAPPDPEVHHECPITQLTALPLLATNPGDATANALRTIQPVLLQQVFLPTDLSVVKNCLLKERRFCSVFTTRQTRQQHSTLPFTLRTFRSQNLLLTNFSLAITMTSNIRQHFGIMLQQQSRYFPLPLPTFCAPSLSFRNTLTPLLCKFGSLRSTMVTCPSEYLANSWTKLNMSP